MTATGRSVLGAASHSGGASLEVGGAHWFAESHEEAQAPEGHEEVDGSIAVVVCPAVAALLKAPGSCVMHVCSPAKALGF